ncbi:carbamoyl-phosphate synthase large subunit [Tenacibaculum sp. MAR_2010_89]|uniref:ATP-grasp domain-containing protein n=1 Tax=Tenacibaculum sp. MAR_2010_89 TaxID=1250198 RepID=UPI000898CC67|nr:ATP-grasp domain-containing protein [Tenacibaculum sp. MAR_2010_89]SED68066.1 carbamoyl-phosphate synthase large subunit [Tenacibaculum sp. MAR_2010_89]
MNKSILIFGVAKLQRSLIEQAKKLGLFTIGIDPDSNAECNGLVDVFKVISGDDYTGTLEIAKKYNISGVITSATDKPLVMMARIAEALNLPFISVKSAAISTDKYLMKNAFREKGIPFAKGKLVKEIEKFNYPIILKPVDNSGSRGVIYCENKVAAEKGLKETKSFTKQESILVEEYIEGNEYSIESLHFGGKSFVIQYTEKITTSIPYNVELGHNQPANISEEYKEQIELIILKIAKSLGFNNCASHTELKIGKKGIFVIESSPRLGGDFITSHLVKLSTGINIEQELIKIAIGEAPVLKESLNKSAIVRFLNFGDGVVNQLNFPDEPKKKWKLEHFSFHLKVGDKIPEIKNSLDRYGEVILSSDIISNAIKNYNIFLIDLKNRIKI